MITFSLSVVGWFGTVASGGGGSADPDCSRYLEAMKRPAVVAALEAWRARLPMTFEEKRYPRVLESSGFGAYSIALDFDYKLLGLEPSAHAEVSVDPGSKKIRFAAITDAKSTGFVFRFKGYEYMFEGSAMKSPRSSTVGVACAVARDGD